jgi:multidrug efflux pump subunit AcrA (membrane-fusion protein)
LDDVAIWNRSLTAEEVSKLYTQGLAGKPVTSVVVTPPVAVPTISQTVNANGTITIVYTDVLYSSETLNGTYVPVPAATSPFVANPATSGKTSVFYKAGR